MKRTVWVEPRTRPDTYSIRWFDPITGEKMREKADGKDDLKKKKRAIEDRLDAYKPGLGDPKAIPLVVMEDYITDALTRDKPIRNTTAGMKRENLTPFLETLFTMDQLTTDKIKTYIAAMRIKKLAIDTVAIRLRDIRAFCNWAHKKGILGVNPWNGIGIPVSTFEGRRLTSGEVKGLFGGMSEDLLDYIGLKLDTGARKGELLQMEFTDIDFDRAYWNVRGIEGKSKSKHDRIIPLTQRAVETLKKRKAQGHKFVFEGFTKRKVFLHLQSALESAKIAGRVREHDIRHTWASVFKGRRDSLKAIAGWKSDVMANRYKHTEIEELREDMEKGSLEFGAVFGAVGEKSSPNT